MYIDSLNYYNYYYYFLNKANFYLYLFGYGRKGKFVILHAGQRKYDVVYAAGDTQCPIHAPIYTSRREKDQLQPLAHLLPCCST